MTLWPLLPRRLMTQICTLIICSTQEYRILIYLNLQLEIYEKNRRIIILLQLTYRDYLLLIDQ